MMKSPSRADKIVKIFGEHPKHIIETINAETKPWYLRPTYSQTEILIDPDGKVRAGTVPALVERLTAHEHSGKWHCCHLVFVIASSTLQP